MEGIYNTLRMHEFQEVGSKDPKQYIFVCETIWAAKNIQDEATNISQLEIEFRQRALLWYIKYQSTIPIGQTRTLENIRKALLNEFQKSKSKSQCIIELKEIKQLSNESVWDFD